jgi:hypothetical protein
MPSAPPPPAPTDDASPVAPPPAPAPAGNGLGRGFFLGVIVGIVLLVGMPIGCAWIDAKQNPGELAGVGGLFLGAMVGAGLLVVGTILAFILPARRRSPVLRGAAHGMLLIIAIAALTAGVCAVGS